MAENDDFDWSTWPGVNPPQYTQFPDDLLDQVMAKVSPAEWKVISYIVRHTFGYKRDADAISIRQMTDGVVRQDGTRLDHGTGLSRRGIINAVQSLQEKGILVVAKRRHELGDQDVNVYCLRMATGVVHSVHQGGAFSAPTRKTLQETIRTESEAVPPETQSEAQVTDRNSDSDDIHRWAEATATALGRPGEARQLATWARKQQIPLEILKAAGEVTAQQSDLQKPIAYLQTVAKVLLAQRQAAAAVGERKRTERRRDALNYARQIYRDPIIGGSWRSVESIVAESYGMTTATEIVSELQRMGQ